MTQQLTQLAKLVKEATSEPAAGQPTTVLESLCKAEDFDDWMKYAYISTEGNDPEKFPAELRRPPMLC